MRYRRRCAGDLVDPQRRRLKAGDEAYAVIKASDVMVAKD
jgi:hypothetical protein